MGSGFLCEEMKCSDLDSGDSDTALLCESLSCTFYRVNFMMCELDSNLNIVIDRGFCFFFKNLHKKHILS